MSLSRSNSARKRAKTTQRVIRSSSQHSYSESKALESFRRYADGDQAGFGVDGVLKFCEDINVLPEDLVVLLLAFKGQCQKMGYFSQEEFLRCMKATECSTPKELAGRVRALRTELTSRKVFRELYRFAFTYARSAAPTQHRSIDTTTAKEMLHVLLGDRWPLLSDFFTFLDEHKVESLNKDQWNSLLEFSMTVYEDLTNYSEDGAWPILLDEFVEWKRAQQGGETGSTGTSPGVSHSSARMPVA